MDKRTQAGSQDKTEDESHPDIVLIFHGIFTNLTCEWKSNIESVESLPIRYTLFL